MLKGRHALVTGGGSGIGRAIALALDRAGAQVSVLGRGEAKLSDTADAFKNGGGVAVADVTDAAATSAAIDARIAAAGPVAILINNAGAAETAPFHRMSEDLWQRMIAVNLTSVVNVTRAVLPAMRGLDYGRIINVASTAGLKGYAYVSAYVAAKHGVVGLTKALALELAQTPITVNALCPGYTQTDMLDQSIETIVSKTGMSADQARKKLAESNPQGRLVTPEEVSMAALYLCGPHSNAMTGQAIAIAGGEVM